VNAASTGGPENVSLSGTGLPAGASVAFDPATISTGTSSTMTVATATSTPAGTYSVTLTATGGMGTASTVFTLTVIGPPTGCSASNTTDTTMSQGSPIVISGCNVSGPLVATVEVHVKDTLRAYLNIGLYSPDVYEHLVLVSSLSFNPLDFGHTLDRTYIAVFHSAPANGQWTIGMDNDGTSIIDSWTITLAPYSAPIAVGPHRIGSVHSGKCVDVAGGSLSDGAQVWQWSCHGGGNQLWQVQQVGFEDYRLVAVHSGRCLTVFHAGEGARIEQQPCASPYEGQQRWWFTPAGPGTYALVSGYSHLCLDVAGASVDDGAALQTYGCHLGANQQWRLDP
jgi:hypothetical protein